MKIYNPFTSPPYKLLLVTCLVAVLVISDNPTVSASTKTSVAATAPGYSALRLFLEDEQYLTLFRRTQMLISFEDISDKSQVLIDKISDSSEKDLEELERLATAKPAISFVEFSNDAVGKATFDSLRIATAKEFLFEGDDFEKNILLSQLKVLRVISHLAKQLEQRETNSRRKKWLNDMSERYENYYQQVNNRITITAKRKA